MATLGRANEQGVARFYGSIGRSVPFFELNPKVGDKIILSTWKTTGDMLLNSVGFTEGSATILNSKRELGKLYTLLEHEYAKESNETQIAIREFLAKWFVKKIDPADSHLYKLTAAIANILLSGEKFDGLIYPTVKMFGNADNVVLDRRFVDKSLQLVSVEYLEVIENEGVQFKTEIIDTSIKWEECGNIEWSGRELGWNYPTLSHITMKGENGEWVNLDEADRRIDPIPTNIIWKNPSPLGLKFKNCYPEAFKASADFSMKGPDGGFMIKFAVVYDFKTREKFLVFYIPKCSYPFETAKTLGNAYNHFMGLGDENVKEIIVENKDTPKPVSSKLFSDSKFMRFFVEDYIDCKKLGTQIIAGYRFEAETSPPSTPQIKYLYKPNDKRE
ncbi:MAG TPA: hypothetical protein VHC48_12835, partial [Puia sp.]|nr:hypothetical protein [Puia sp.]